MMPLLAYCRLAIQEEASRGIAWQTWHKYTPATSFDKFCTFWAKAREIEKAKV
jgi:hypothetical protein